MVGVMDSFGFLPFFFSRAFHLQKKRCAKCGYPNAKIRGYALITCYYLVFNLKSMDLCLEINIVEQQKGKISIGNFL